MRVFASSFMDLSVSKAATLGQACSSVYAEKRNLSAIHNEKLRMPAVLRKDDQEAWLNGNPRTKKRY